MIGCFIFVFKQKTAYDVRISDWSSDVCSSDLVSYQVEPVHAGDKQLREDGLAMRTALVDAVAAQGAHPLTFYPSFVEEDNPASGFVDGVAPDRKSTRLNSSH